MTEGWKAEICKERTRVKQNLQNNEIMGDTKRNDERFKLKQNKKTENQMVIQHWRETLHYKRMIHRNMKEIIFLKITLPNWFGRYQIN